jgi:hypothetical protein
VQRGVTSERLAVGLLFIVIATLACMSPAHSDTWWHLRVGQDIWQSGAISLVETYSHTAEGREFPNHEWLAELIFYGAYSLGGLPALTLLCAALIVSAYALAWRMADATFETKFLIVMIGLSASTSLWSLRPQVFTLALFALTCNWLVAGRLWPLPLLFAAWTNLHGGVAFGMVAVGAAWLAALVFDRRSARRLFITMTACALATLASPLGWRLWVVIPESIGRSRVNNLMEWRPPDFSLGLVPFWVAAAALPLLMVLRRRQLTERATRLGAIALAVLPVAMRSFRNVPIFLIVAMMAIASIVKPASRQLAPRRPLPRERTGVNAALLGIAALIGVVVVLGTWLRGAEDLGWQPMSPQAAAAVAECPDPIYNTYVGGGVLLWFVQSKRVFIDNRQDPYPLELMAANSNAEFTGDYSALFGSHNIRCAAVAPKSAIAARLESDPAWTVRHADDQWMVFGRE